MEQRITFITFGVNDLYQSIDFYELNYMHLSLYDRKELAKDATMDVSG